MCYFKIIKSIIDILSLTISKKWEQNFRLTRNWKRGEAWGTVLSIYRWHLSLPLPLSPFPPSSIALLLSSTLHNQIWPHPFFQLPAIFFFFVNSASIRSNLHLSKYHHFWKIWIWSHCTITVRIVMYCICGANQKYNINSSLGLVCENKTVSS